MKVSLLAVVVLTVAVSLSIAADPECVYRKIRDLPMHWANPSDCGRFYRCTNKNVKREVICPGDKEYNAKTGKCANGGRGLCKLSLSAPLVGTDNVCATEVSGAYLPQTGNCRNYYICNELQAFAQACPAGSYFDLTSTTCVPDPESTCWQNKCIGIADGSYLANTPSCQTFLVCAKDQAVAQNCGVGSYFDTFTANCHPDVNNELCWENYCTDVADGVSLKDASNCNVYYVCTAGKTVKQQCPEGSYFDTTALECKPGDCPAEETTTESPIDPTTEVTCEGEETTTETPCEGEETTTEYISTEEPTTEAEHKEEETTTTETSEACTCPGGYADGEFVPHPDNCQLFYICADSQLIETSCQAGNYFEPTVNACLTDSEHKCPQCTETNTRDKRSIDSTEDVVMSDVVEKEELVAIEHESAVNAGTVEHLATCLGIYQEGQLVAHPTVCHKFQVCYGGELIVQDCGLGMYYDGKQHICSVDTENLCPASKPVVQIPQVEQTLLVEVAASAVNQSCTCPGGYAEGDMLPHPSDCDKYYICYDGQLIEKSCGKGNYFNKLTTACAADTTNSCWPADCGGTVPDPEPVNVCLGQGNNVMVPNPYKCDAFYFCTNGVATAESCYAGEWFDPAAAACAVDVNANCINPCVNTTGIAFLPHPDCTKYYLCNNGQTHVESCTAGTAFDDVRGICSATVTCAANLCTNQPDGTTFPVAGSTSSFYYCLSGVPTLLHCVDDYGFNPAVGVCLPQPSTDCTQATCANGDNVPPFTTISGDLSAFCYCMKTAAYKESCQDDYVFNPALQICYSNAPCDPEICDDMPEYTRSPNRNDTQSFCLCVTNVPVIVDCPFNGTYWPLADSCKPAPVADPNCDQNYCLHQPEYTNYPALNGITGGFCTCQELVGTFQICEDNTQFNPNYLICLPAGVGAACNVAECAVNPNAIFPAVNNPYSFCYCADETTVNEIQCPSGEKFNATMLICLPEPCNTQYCLNPTNANSGTPFPANNYPYGFCLCNGNEPVLHSCEGGFMFDPTHLICLPEVDEQCSLALCQNASPTNQFPTPTISDPNSFCYCFGPTSVQLFNCPTGMSYDTSKQICLDPNAGVDDGCTCPGGYKEGQFLAHPTNCQKFYICSGGILHETDCGVGNYFSEASDACVAKTTNGMFSASSAATCVGAYHEGDLVPHHSDRKRFFVCYRAQLLERTCGEGNVFDGKRLVCVRESLASTNTGGRWKQRSVVAATTGDVEDFRCIDNEKRSVPANCSQYENCVDTRWRRRTCTEQRYYNPEQQKCLEPRDDTICIYAKVSGLPACNNATEGSMLPGKSASNCAQYYRCSHGKWRLRACAKQQYYARQLNTCIAASDDGNINNKNENDGNNNPTLDLCDARNKTEETLAQKGCRHTAVRAYSANCVMYLMCLEDEWWYQYCPLGMYFSRTQNYCMPNDAAQCLDGAAIEITVNTASAAEVALEFAEQNCSATGTLRPSALACDKYYVCMTGRWHQQSCPPAHYYNVTAEACVKDVDGICAQLTALLPACVTNERRAFPLNCTAFEECRADGVWQRISCPPATSYDDVLRQCVIVSNHICASSGLRRVCRQGDIRRLPLTQNCTEFYHCSADSWRITECLKGYTFAEDLRMCVPHAADDKCRATNQTWSLQAIETAAAAEDEAEDINCVGREDSVTLSHTADCSRFYLCLAEVAIEQACPLGSFYDSTLGYCRPNDGSACRLPLTGACAEANYGEFVAHADECRAYYHCSAINGTQLMYCPTGEYYHAYMRQCRADHGECVSASVPPEERKCAGVEHGARLPHELYCNIYYACVRGLAFPIECPDQHRFNAVLARCLYDETEQCQNGVLVNGTTPYSCGNLTDGSYLPDRTDCSRYYICSEGTALPKRCNSGAFFDAQQLLCLPDDGSCPFVDQPNNQTVPPDPIICVGKHGVLMPDPANCNEFYACINGKLRHERCYADNFFNVTINQCQSYERTTGDIDDLDVEAAVIDQLQSTAVKAPQCSDSPTEFTALCTQIPDGTAIAEQGDCRFYISCQDEDASVVPVSQRCRNGESFDSLLGFCRQNDGTCQLDNGQRVGECSARHGQLARDADNCRGYFVCINGQKIASECAAYEYFSRSQNLCLKDEAMQCSSTLPANTENASGVSCTGLSESMLYPYTHDRCRSYFQCVKGVPKIHECADGLFFDVVTTRCVKEIGECVMPPTPITATMTTTATTAIQNLQRAPDGQQPTNLKICAQALLDQRNANLVDHCRSYYTCQADGGVSYTICPNGTLFSAAIGDCVEAAKVICGME